LQEASPLRELTCHMGSHSITCHPCSPHSKRHLSRLNHYNTRYYFNVCSKADISRHGTKTKKQKKEKLKSKTDMLRGIGKQSGNQWSQSILAQQIAGSDQRKRALISTECRNTCLVVALVSGTSLQCQNNNNNNTYNDIYAAGKLVAWHSGRTSVSGRRTFPVLRSTCS